MSEPDRVSTRTEKIHDSVIIEPWSSIERHVAVGAKTRIRSHVIIGGNTILGEDNDIFSFSVLGSPPQTLKPPLHEPRLNVGDGNAIREHVTINAGGAESTGTVVGNFNLIMSHCHIGHDAHLASHVVVGSGTSLAGHVQVSDHAWLGGMCGIGQRVRVGRLAFLGGHSALDRDLPPFCAAYGARPRRIRGLNLVGLRRAGIKRCEILQLQHALQTWQDTSLSVAEALARLTQHHAGNELVAEFVGFLKSTRVGALR